MLDNFFTRQSTIRLYRAGALGPFADRFAEHLVACGYSPSTGQPHLRAACRLCEWLRQNDCPLELLDEARLDIFLDPRIGERKPGDPTFAFKTAREGARHFLKWLRAEGIVVTPTPSQALPELLTGLRAWLFEQRGMLPSSVYDYYLPPLRRFVASEGDTPSSYQATRIRQYILNLSEQFGPYVAKQAVNALRALLRYCIVQGLCAPGLIDAVPTIAHWKRAHLPAYAQSADVERLLAACDTTRPLGRRNHAILLLLARLGLRAGDVIALKLDDIDWNAATLRVTGKGRRTARLPLPQDVGDALLRWLNDGRPERDDAHVFLHLRAPYPPIAQGPSVGTMVTRLAQRSGITLPRNGAHILRHTFATTLLREGVLLPTIGALLRHSSLETTTLYAKVDVTLLASVAQPWPEEVSP